MPEKQIKEDFHRLFFDKRYRQKPPGWSVNWRGVEVIKYPNDLLVLQEIIWEIKPDLLIETGTKWGGSALFYASIMDMLGHGQVITVDFKAFKVPEHPRITYLRGNSTSAKTHNKIKKHVNSRKVKTCMVCLDSRHKEDHVRQEIELYKDFVTVDSYLIVEDTKLNGNPVHTPYPQDGGRGPAEAVIDFLANNDSFIVDRSREKFLITSNPGGFLKRVH